MVFVQIEERGIKNSTHGGVIQAQIIWQLIPITGHGINDILDGRFR